MSRPLPSRPALLWLALWLAAAAALLAGTLPAEPSQQVAGAATLTHGLLARMFSDTMTHDYPAFWWGWTQIKATGLLPLWNPSWFGGEPFLASQTFMPFYPPNWLGGLLPLPLGFNLQYPLHLALAAAVMAWACRRRGLGWWAAGLAGLSWGFGGHLATLVGPGHIQKLQALTWLPLVTTGAWHLGRGEARKGLLPLATGLALQITAGHPQIVWLTLGVAGLEAAAGLAGSFNLAARANPHYRPLDFRFGALGLALGLAVGLSAVFWVPTMEFAKLSNRQGALTWDDATRGSLPPEEAFEFALPRLRGDSLPHGRAEELRGAPYHTLYHGRYGESKTSAPERIVSDYVGAGVLIFAFLALLARHRRRRAAWGYLLMAAAALALSMGRYVPWLYGPAFRLIPGLSHFRSPSTMMALFSYGLTLAAAFGVEAFVRMPAAQPGATREGGKRTAEGRRLWLQALPMILGMLGLAVFYFRFGHELKNLAQDATRITETTAVAFKARMDAVEKEWLFVVAVRHTTGALLLIGALTGLWALLLTAPRTRSRQALELTLLAGLTLAWGGDLLVNARPFWNSCDLVPYMQFLTRHWAQPLWAKSDDPIRYLEPGNELSNRALTLSDFQRGLRVGSVSGYHPVAYGRYFEMLDRLGFLHPNFLRLFAVNYLLWPVDAPGERPEGYKEFAAEQGRALLRNDEINYVRPVKYLRAVKDWPTLLAQLADPKFHPDEATLILQEDLPKKYWDKPYNLRDLHLQARVYAAGPGETRFRFNTMNQGLVVVSEPAVPGWHVKLWRDNQPVPIEGPEFLRVFGYFVALGAPAGRSDCLLYYDPASQRLGIYITLLTLGALGWLTGRRIAGKKSDRKEAKKKSKNAESVVL